MLSRQRALHRELLQEAKERRAAAAAAGGGGANGSSNDRSSGLASGNASWPSLAGGVAPSAPSGPLPVLAGASAVFYHGGGGGCGSVYGNGASCGNGCGTSAAAAAAASDAAPCRDDGGLLLAAAEERLARDEWVACVQRQIRDLRVEALLIRCAVSALLLSILLFLASGVLLAASGVDRRCERPAVGVFLAALAAFAAAVALMLSESFLLVHPVVTEEAHLRRIVRASLPPPRQPRQPLHQQPPVCRDRDCGGLRAKAAFGSSASLKSLHVFAA